MCLSYLLLGSIIDVNGCHKRSLNYLRPKGLDSSPNGSVNESRFCKRSHTCSGYHRGLLDQTPGIYRSMDLMF